MKINIFDKALEILLNKTHLNNPSVASFLTKSYLSTYSFLGNFSNSFLDKKFSPAKNLYPGYK